MRPTAGITRCFLLLLSLLSVPHLLAQEGGIHAIFLPILDIDSTDSGYELLVEGFREGMEESTASIRFGRSDVGMEPIRIKRILHRDHAGARMLVSASIDLTTITSPLLLVEFPIDTTTISPLRRAALQGIYLGTESESLISAGEAIDGPEDEQAILSEMIGLLTATGEYINLDPSTDPELTSPIAFGNMAGTSLADALESADSSSLNRAIEFFISDPDQFRGTWTPIVEAYAWWVAYGGPNSPDQILGSLKLAGSDSERERLFDRFRTDIVEYDYLDRWITEAEVRGSEGDETAGRLLVDIGLHGAEYLDRPVDMGWGWFVLGRLHDMNDRLDSADYAYRESIDHFESAGDSVGLSWGLNNAGTVRRRLGDTEGGALLLGRSIAIKEGLIAGGSARVSPGALAQSYGARGTARDENGDPDGALDDYGRAADLFRRESTYTSAGYYHHQIGLVCRREGRSVQARAQFDTAAGLYRLAGDLEGEADMLDEIAYSHSLEGEYQRAIEYYTRASELHLESGEIDDAGFSMANIGQSWWSLGDFHSAEEFHRRAIVLRQESGNERGEAYSWKKLGIMFHENGDPLRAKDAIERAEKLYRVSGGAEDRAEMAVVRGDFLSIYGSATSTVASYNDAIRQYIAVGNTSQGAEVLATLGDFHFGRQELSQAEEAYTRSRRMVLENGDTTGAYRATSGLGLVAWRNGEFDLASDWLTEARRLAELRDSRDDVAWATMNIGQVDLARGRTGSARRAYSEVLDIYESTGNYDGQIDARLNLGYLHVEAGRFDSALQEFDAAARVAEGAGRRRRLPDVFTAHAGLHLLLGEFDEALAADSLSLTLAMEADNLWGVAGAYVGLGNTWNTMGEYIRAYSAYESADSLYLLLGDTLARGTPLNNMGTIWFFQGDYERALDRFNTVLRLLREHNTYSEFLAIVVTNIGEVYYEQGRLEDSEEWLRTGIEIADSVGARRILASGLTILTKGLREQGRLDESLVVAARAAELSDDIGETEQRAEIHGVRGDLLLDAGFEQEGEKELMLGISLAREIGSHRYLWRPLYRLALHREAGGRIEEAVTLLEEAVEAIEHTNERIVGGEEARSLYSSHQDRIGVYENLVRLLIDRGDVEKGLGYLERSSSSDLRSRFIPATADDPGASGSLLETGRRMKVKVDLLAERIALERSAEGGSEEKMSGLRQVYSVAESEYISFVNETIREEPGLRSYFSNAVNPVELRSRKNGIPEGTVVLSYLPGERTLFTFVATRDTVIARVVPVGRVELTQTVAAMHSSLSLPPGSGLRIDGSALIEEYSGKLWSWLVEPIWDRIAEGNNIAIIPSGILGLVPFSMLSSETGRPLGMHNTTFQISDLSLFLRSDRKSSDRKVAAFANPDGTLPYSQEEAEGIVDLFPGSMLLMGEEATESRAKNVPPGYSILHFATHGSLDYGNVDQSWLTLAPDEQSGEDGRLTLSEVWGMTNLSDCRMVTLSACNTAVGEDLVEGWPVNPANAFLQVGVPSVVATLWRVDDQATSVFMVEFYRQLRTVGAADALRAARVSMRTDPRYSDPYFWAPFILLGDWR